MSIDLLAYSDDPSPIDISDFVSAFRNNGYECRVIRGETHPVTEGALFSEDFVVGWHKSFFRFRAAEKAATTGDWKAIADLQDRDVVGACVLDIWDEPERYNDANELREHEEVYGSEYVANRRASRVRWYIRLPAGRNGLSVEIAEAVLRTLLELRGGMFEDPQIGEFEMVRRGGGT